MGNRSTGAHVTSDAGPYAIVPLWIVEQLNRTSSANAGLSVFIALHKWSDRNIYAYPSHASIGKVANLSVATVKRGIRALEDIGALSVVPRWINADGQVVTTRPDGENVEQTSNGYNLHYVMRDPTPGQECTDPPGQEWTHPPGQKCTTNQTHIELDPVKTLTHVADMVHDAEIIAEWETSFMAWWSMQIRKVGKDKARTAWRKLSEPDRVAALEAMPHHVQRWRSEGVAEKFIPHPVTWLNGRRWEDELDTGYKPAGSLVEQISHYALEQRRQESHERTRRDDSPRGLGSGHDRLE